MKIDAFKLVKDNQHLYLRDYLPSLFPGKWERNTFVRSDNHSWKFNFELGIGGDFATGEALDIITIVANEEGLFPIDAAKKIANDWGLDVGVKLKARKLHATPVKEEKPKHIPVDHFPPDLAFPLPKKPDGRWLYKDKQGRGIGWVVRYDTPNRMYLTYRPDVNGVWQIIPFERPYPLYRADLLTNTIIITEGEKAADAAAKLCPWASTTTTVQGAKSLKYGDWSQIPPGAKVIFWRDNDEPGIKAQNEVCEILLKQGCNPQVFNDDAFKDKAEGYDAADWEKENAGLSCETFIKANVIEYQRRDSAGSPRVLQLEENKSVPAPLNQAFKQLGKVKNEFAFYTYESGQVQIVSAEKLNRKMFIYSLTEGDGKAWDGAKTQSEFDYIARGFMMNAAKIGQFDVERIRGKGAWLDGKRIVFNTGNYLYVDGQKVEIKDFDSHFVYIKSPAIIEKMDTQASREELDQFLKICTMFSWDYDVAGLLLAGWIMVAPICGTLPWRPHIYVTGMVGSGKSTIHEKVLAKTLGDCTINTLGDSTKAGLSQTLAIDALPVIYDELENDNQVDVVRNEGVVKMARHSSSSQKGKTVKGTGDQSGAKGYIMRSCFCFSSVTPSVKHYADVTRITLLSLKANRGKTPEQEIAHYKEMLKSISDLMGGDGEDNGWSERFITYANRNVFNIIESYRILKTVAQLQIQEASARIADQLAMLLAGGWAYKSDKPITEEEALKLIDTHDWSELIPAKRQENQLKLVDKLRQHKIRFRNEEKDDNREISRTIAAMVSFLADDSDNADLNRETLYYKAERAEEILKNIGIRLYVDAYKERWVLVSNSSLEMEKILRDTQWQSNWGHSLKAVPGAFAMEKTHRFGTAIGKQRCVALPLDLFVNNELDLTGGAEA